MPRSASMLLEPPQLHVDDHRQVLLRERVENDDVVHPVQELRPEGLAKGVEQPLAHIFVTVLRPSG